MGLRSFVHFLLHGERRQGPRTPEAVEAVRRKQAIERRLRRLEMDLQVHTGKQRHDK